MSMELLQRIIVAATPGWAAVVADVDQEDKLYRLPIVGWLCETYEIGFTGRTEQNDASVLVRPVVCTGTLSDDTVHALQRDDDPRFFAYGETFDSEPELLAFFQRQEKLRRHAGGRRCPGGGQETLRTAR
jgi:hypothetical protein